MDGWLSKSMNQMIWPLILTMKRGLRKAKNAVEKKRKVSKQDASSYSKKSKLSTDSQLFRGKTYACFCP